MMKRKTYFRHRPDLVSEELIAALSEKATYEFPDLFDVIYQRLRARNATSGGQEMLRLRVYEKLQTLASQGIVKKNGKSYSAVKLALQGRAEEMATAKDAAEKRRAAIASTASILHSE